MELIIAVQANDVSRLRQVLANRKAAQTSSKGPSDNSYYSLQMACEFAAQYNHPAALEFLLNEIDEGIISAAARHGSIDVFKLLIARGWKVNQPLGDRGDALMMAVSAKKLELVKFLIAHGADPNANLSMEKFTPLECAVSSTTSIMMALVDAGAQVKGCSALQMAAGDGITEAISYLLDCGAPINEIPNSSSNYKFATALCEAALQGHLDAVKLLLENGADVNGLDRNGKTALELAEMNKHDACIDILRYASGRPAIVRPRFCR